MRQAELFLLFTAPLESAGISYMVSGSVASMIYGEPRLTNDIDIILHLAAGDAERLVAEFPPAEFYCPPPEVVAIESRRRSRGHFNLIHHETGHKADIYLSGDDPLHAWGFSNRRRLEVADGRSIWVAPPEYVILRKLEYFKEGGSEKHRGDIRGMLEVSADSIDRKTVASWAAKLGVTREWAAMTAEIEAGNK